MSAWEIDESTYPTSGSLEDKVRFWLQYAVLAPSAHNNQPWQVTISDHVVTLRPDMSLVSSGTPRLTVISLGAFVENFAEAAAHFGYSVEIRPLPHATNLKTLAIQMHIADGVDADQHSFSGITKRHTNRGEYNPEPLPATVMDQLCAVPAERGVSIHFLTDEGSREQIAKMAGQGMRIAVSLPPLRRELARFVNWKREGSDIGMYVEAMVRDPAEAETGEDFILHKIDIPGEARFTYEKFRTAPLHVVVSTAADNGQAWLNAGRSIQRLLNKAAELGLSHCIAAAPTEVPPFLPRVRHILKTDERPQLTLRLGSPLDPSFTHHSPRRSVSSIVHD